MKRLLLLSLMVLCSSTAISALKPDVFRDTLRNNQFSSEAFDPSRPFALSVWVRPDKLSSRDYENPIISQHGEASGWEVRLAKDGVVFMLTTNGEHQIVKVDHNIPIGDWTFVEARYTGDKIVARVNHGKSNSKAVSGKVTPYKGKMSIAQNTHWTSRRLTGRVRNLEIVSYDKTYQSAAPDMHVPEIGDVIHHRPLVANFSKPTITGDFTVVKKGVDDNPYYKGSHRLLNPNSSYITAEVDINNPRQYNTLTLNHLSSMSGGQAGYSPITIRVNNVAVVKNHNPSGGNGNYFVEKFDIRDYLKKGKNTITISLGAARTHYWIKSLELS